MLWSQKVMVRFKWSFVLFCFLLHLVRIRVGLVQFVNIPGGGRSAMCR